MAKKNSPTPLGYDGMEDQLQLVSGRWIPMAEMIAEHAVPLYGQDNPGLDVSQLVLAWNNLTDVERNEYVCRAFDKLDRAAEDAAALDEARKGERTHAVLAPKAERKLGDALIQCTVEALRELPRPWAAMSEDEQDAMLERITKRAREAAQETVRMLAARDNHHVMATLDQVTIKKGAKIALSVNNSQVNEYLLEAIGLEVVLVLSPDYTLAKEIKQPAADPDQRPLGLDNSVQHSDPEG